MMLATRCVLSKLLVLFIAGLLVTSSGCSKYKTAPVSGTITLDDEPLEDATVTFTPAEAIEGEVIMSSGRTDQAGNYQLEIMSDQSSGAVVGKHTVRISRNFESESDIMTAAEAKRNFLPPHDFQFDVATGDNTANFNLESRLGKR